jgi:hypothetical protein
MLYRVLADIVLIAHFCFVLFVIFGGLLVLWRRRIIWLHLPAVVWGVLIELLLIGCPLTTFENHLRALGGEAGYEPGGFIEHFFSSLLYWQLTPQNQIMLGVLLIAFNSIVYFFIFRRRKRIFV